MSNPQFVDPGNDNFYLQAGSPCLTASETGSYIGALPEMGPTDVSPSSLGNVKALYQ